MASLENVVQILIKAKDEASKVVSQTFNNINASAKQLENAGSKINKSIDPQKVSSTINSVSNQMLALGGSMLGVVGIASHFGLELNKSIASAGSVAGLTVDKFKEFEKVAREMSLTTTISAKEVADGMYYIASAGYKGQEVIEAVRGTVALANGTLSDMATTSQLVVSTLSSFGLSASESAKVADAFAYAITNSQASVRKLADSMKYVGPVAKSVGLSVEEVTSALMLFYNAGLTGEQAGTSLRNILLSLVDPSSEAQKALEQLGISLEDIDPRKHGLDEIAKTFAEAGVSVDQLATLVGKEGVSALSVLIEKGEQLKVLENNLKNSSGAAEELNEKVKQTPYGQYQLMINQLKNLAYEVFPSVVEAAKSFLEPVIGMVKWFTSLDDGIKKVIAQMTVYGGVLLTTAGLFGKLTSGIINTITNLKTLTGLFPALSNTAVASLNGITATIGKVAGVVGLLIYDITTAIKLGSALGDLFKIKQETKAIEQFADVSELSNKLIKEVSLIDKTAISELTKQAKQLVEQGIVDTMQEAELVVLSLANTGRLGEVLKEFPNIRSVANKALVTYNVRIDFGNFDLEWKKAGENIKNEIRNAMYRGVGL